MATLGDNYKDILLELSEVHPALFLYIPHSFDTPLCLRPRVQSGKHGRGHYACVVRYLMGYKEGWSLGLLYQVYLATRVREGFVWAILFARAADL